MREGEAGEGEMVWLQGSNVAGSSADQLLVRMSWCGSVGSRSVYGFLSCSVSASWN